MIARIPHLVSRVFFKRAKAETHCPDCGRRSRSSSTLTETTTGGHLNICLCAYPETHLKRQDGERRQRPLEPPARASGTVRTCRSKESHHTTRQSKR